MATSQFRIHPAIGIARVGNSEEYYLAPETAAGEIVSSDGLMGGLPIRPGTEADPITDTDLRDAAGNVKRQAVRFRIYRYDGTGTYPDGPSVEIKPGSVVDGKTVKNIIWSVHVANKKQNTYKITSANGQEEGIAAYENGQTPPVRNSGFAGTDDLADATRRLQLVIDPGPRVIQWADGTGQVVAFDTATQASYVDGTAIMPLPSYAKSFPADHFQLYEPLGPLTSLGELRLEDGTGRLIVTGGFGKTVAITTDGRIPPLDDAIDNNEWFDDTSDGPVNAVIVFDDGSSAPVHGAWVTTADPGYAPQTRNVVSTWDDVYDTWVRELNLVPSMFSNGSFQTSYQPSFSDDIQPIFHAAMLQRWNTNLPDNAVKGHNMIGAIAPTDDPTRKIPNFKSLIRDPDSASDISTGSPMMPLSLGDAQKSFLTVSKTQYFLLSQWFAKAFTAGPGPKLGDGEKLDQVALANCLGGRYSPGIELTFIVRDTKLYITDWQTEGCGPFRIDQAQLNYATASAGQPFLTVGYVPLRPAAVEPGDLSKFMSAPWHTDYNSCAVHEPDPNPAGNNTLFWSWPAERPLAAHPARLCTYDQATGTWTMGRQAFCIRGAGTETDYPANAGKYQTYSDYVENWYKVGFIIQGSQIDTGTSPNYPATMFLEVQSQFDTGGEPVVPWPTADFPPVPKQKAKEKPKAPEHA